MILKRNNKKQNNIIYEEDFIFSHRISRNSAARQL